MGISRSQEVQALLEFTYVASDSSFRHRERAHQTWWRAFVLGDSPGPHPRDPDEPCGNTVDPRESNEPGVLLGEEAAAALADALEKRRATKAAGLIDPRRVTTNLLSSQPMAFNLFGPLWADHTLATKFVQTIDPDCSSVEAVEFEFVPNGASIGDNSAFDVAVIYSAGREHALLGLECKYTDDFTARDRKDPENRFYGAPGHRSEAAYRAAYELSREVFAASFESCVANARLNQLFRNALIAETAYRSSGFARVSTGLVCHPDDERGVDAGRAMQAAVRRPFQLVTLDDAVARLQRLDLTRAQRDMVNLFWARYLGRALSESLASTLMARRQR